MSAAMQHPEPASLTAARLYHRLGWSVVPVRPGEKLPAVEWARYQHTPATEAQLNDWFGIGGYGIGLVQGATAGTIVLDFDGELGQATRAALEREHGPLPATPEAITPGGGCHIVLRHPGVPVPTRKGVLPGMDVRGDGGFIVAHPSVHQNGRQYHWDVDAHPEDIAVADAPAWVVDLVCGAVTAGHDTSGAVVHVAKPGALGMPVDIVADGREVYMRDTVLAVLRDMRDRTGEMPTAEALFAEVWPQYSARVDLTRPGRGAAEVMAKCAYTIRRVQGGAVSLGVAPPAVPVAVPEPQQAGATSQRKRILTIEEVEALPPPRWLIEGLIPEKSLTVPYGPPKKGKTFIILSAALHIADGKEWMGRKVESGAVVYIAGEGVGGLSLRLKAMRSHYKIGTNIPFWVIPRAVNFAQKVEVADLIKLIRDTVLDEPIAMVVVDTLARAMPGVDENSSQEVGVVIAACDQIKQDLDCAVLPIHHSGKDMSKGLRGSSAIHGAVDASFSINGTGKSVTLTPTDQKDADPGAPLVFEMVEVAVGIGRSSLVPVLVQSGAHAPAEERAPARLSITESLALRALQEALAAHSCMPGTSGIPANVPACTDAEWREAFRNLNAGESWEAARKAFQRVSKQLIHRKIVGSRVPYVWKVQADEGMQ